MNCERRDNTDAIGEPLEKTETVWLDRVFSSSNVENAESCALIEGPVMRHLGTGTSVASCSRDLGDAEEWQCQYIFVPMHTSKKSTWGLVFLNRDPQWLSIVNHAH